uniref:Uncharacterized protein n=1 Tax=Alexandrium catenella TaxID=2925 RepID=A0A7S1QHH4_ALECA|mmetsp:Transcript_32839/g.88962  ORF Transcript_32839/g.88962 Transcript_32839/m.88962 type:complete len:506 (+) Transcript_32839:250-1767(+)
MLGQPGEVDGLPRSGVAVYRPGVVSRAVWCDSLRSSLARYPLGTCTFDNIEISNTPWTSEDFSTLLAILTAANAAANRIKAFRCKLDDDAIFFLAKWLEHLPLGRLPSEIHLSHNVISHIGFEALFKAVESKAAVLPPRVPVWLRIEENKLNAVLVQALVGEGRVCLADTNACGCRMCKKVWQGVAPLFHMRYGLKQGGSSLAALPAAQCIPAVLGPPPAGPLPPGMLAPGTAPAAVPAQVQAIAQAMQQQPQLLLPQQQPQQPQQHGGIVRQKVIDILQSAQANAMTSQAHADQAAHGQAISSQQKNEVARAEAKTVAHAVADEINKRLATMSKEEGSQGQSKAEASGDGLMTQEAMLAHIRKKREEFGLPPRSEAGGKAASGVPAAPAAAASKPADSGRRSPERRQQRHQGAGTRHRSKSPSKKHRARSRRRSPRHRGSPRRSRDRSRSAKRRGRGAQNRSASREGRRAGPSAGAQEVVRRKESEEEVTKIQAKVQQLFAGLA